MNWVVKPSINANFVVGRVINHRNSRDALSKKNRSRPYIRIPVRKEISLYFTSMTYRTRNLFIRASNHFKQIMSFVLLCSNYPSYSIYTHYAPYFQFNMSVNISAAPSWVTEFFSSVSSLKTEQHYSLMILLNNAVQRGAFSWIED